ncbi:MAG TPA: glutamate-5-semialdehyde dehydrogenase [Candidatus Lokiarchaeia archaeon]|nr:glutamate-5-semialdehyde dehydrogenase [Candidatus Lokiarchaeia archaeon]
MEDVKEAVLEQARAAKEAAVQASLLSEEARNRVLNAIAAAIDDAREEIKGANEIDVEQARNDGLAASFIDRLALTDGRIDGMIDGLKAVAKLPDQVGHIIEMQKRPNGLLIGKMVVPIGCIAIIYEARPNVTVDATGICIKAGNTIILRGGSEAINSNKKIASIIAAAAEKEGFPAGGIQFVGTTDREAVDVLLKARKYIDLLLPRGGAEFIEKVVANAQVPIIETGAGNCHVYVDENADIEMAAAIVFNGKVSRPSVCNATKKVIMHEAIAEQFLAIALPKLEEAGVEFLVHENAEALIPGAKVMTEPELYEEFLDMRLGFIVVQSIDEAINHVNKYSSHHSESIITREYSRAMQFLNAVDSAAVFWNASTRFTDGGEFGMGAEIGISTQKLHARGPMSVKELTTTKYVIFGTGQIRK